ncbi:MAG: hypothetical protein IKR92_01865 [Alphaproteobacteria bacterium]|nr:hypothetical protein [Alphaproteobacteria bacterium]
MSNYAKQSVLISILVGLGYALIVLRIGGSLEDIIASGIGAAAFTIVGCGVHYFGKEPTKRSILISILVGLGYALIVSRIGGSLKEIIGLGIGITFALIFIDRLLNLLSGGK